MKTQKIYGTPTLLQTKQIKSRQDFDVALRNNDTKLLMGMGDGDGSNTGQIGMGATELFGGIQTSKFSNFSDYLTAATSKVWATARAFDTVANVCISTDLSYKFRDQAKNHRRMQANPRTELVNLMQNPNPYETISELLYLWVCHMKGTGNCFWLKDQMDGYGRPRAIYCLSPVFMRIIPDANSKVSKYIYRINGHDIEFDPSEIIHFKRPNAVDPIWGLGEIEQDPSLYEDYINRALYNARFMANGAMPSSVLVRESFDGTDEQWRLMKKKFAEEYGGVRNSGKTAWMNGKWSLLQMGITAQQMQELEKKKQNLIEIFLNHGVPLSVVGYGSANYATARQEDINFRKYTCLPLMNWFIDVMNSDRGFIKNFNPELKLDFSLSGLVDVEQIMKDYGPLFDRAGLSSNDLRELCGLPHLDNPYLDQYFIQASMVPVEIAGVAIPSEQDINADPSLALNPPKPSSESGGESVDTADG